MFGLNQGSEVVYQCSTRLTAGSGIGVGVFIALVFAWILGRDWLLMDKGNLWMIAVFMLVGVLIACGASTSIAVRVWRRGTSWWAT